MRFLKIFFISIFIFNGGYIYGQITGSKYLDSLLQELSKQKEDTNKVLLLKDIASKYKSVNPDEGILYGQNALNLAIKLNWKIGIARSYAAIGENYHVKSDFTNTLEYFFNSLKITEELNYNNGTCVLLGNIGGVYLELGQNTKASEYSVRGLKLSKEINNKNGIEISAANLGAYYNAQGKYPEALEYFYTALEASEEIKDKYKQAGIDGNIGDIYLRQNDESNALKYYNNALKIEKEIGDRDGLARITYDIGRIFETHYKFRKALEYYFNALALDESIGNKSAIAILTGNIGNIYTSLHKYDTAIGYHLKSIKLAREIGDKNTEAGHLGNTGWDLVSLVLDTGQIKTNFHSIDIPYNKKDQLRKAIEYISEAIVLDKELKSLDNLQYNYRVLSVADSLLGDYKDALLSLHQYMIYSDSIFSKENAIKIAIFESKKKAEADSFKHERLSHVAEIKLENQRVLSYIGVAGILILGIFSVIVMRLRNKSEYERKKSDDLLLNILPSEVANELKTNGKTEAKHYENVTVLFTDFVNFTIAGESLTPQELVDELHTCFKAFDEIIGRYNIEKIKTIGDAYLCVSGLPIPNKNHAENITNAALDISSFMQKRFAEFGKKSFQIRIGINSGSVVAGVVGFKKFAYDIWGDTVNTAARMEQNSSAGKINISETTYQLIKEKFAIEYRGEMDAKNKGKMKMYFVHGRI